MDRERDAAIGLTAGRFAAWIGLLALLATAVGVWATLTGSEEIDLATALDASLAPNMHREILFRVRLPRVIVGLLVGGALGSVGAAFQGMLRNPLAAPHIIGVSGGAGCGAAIGFYLGLSAVSLPPMAFVGALAAMTLVYVVARRGAHLSVTRVLLAGVMANAFFGAAIVFVQTLAAPVRQKSIFFWLMGQVGVGADSPSKILFLAVVVVVGAGYLCLLGRRLNLFAAGEESARQLGVNAERLKLQVFIVGSLLTAACVCSSGMIGFVGLVVPHMVRMLAGPDQRLVLPGSFFLGASFLVVCDTIARTLPRGGELPVGVVTAIVGVPLFLHLLRSRAAE